MSSDLVRQRWYSQAPAATLQARAGRASGPAGTKATLPTHGQPHSILLFLLACGMDFPVSTGSHPGELSVASTYQWNPWYLT